MSVVQAIQSMVSRYSSLSEDTRHLGVWPEWSPRFLRDLEVHGRYSCVSMWRSELESSLLWCLGQNKSQISGTWGWFTTHFPPQHLTSSPSCYNLTQRECPMNDQTFVSLWQTAQSGGWGIKPASADKKLKRATRVKILGRKLVNWDKLVREVPNSVQAHTHNADTFTLQSVWK